MEEPDAGPDHAPPSLPPGWCVLLFLLLNSILPSLSVIAKALT